MSSDKLAGLNKRIEELRLFRLLNKSQFATLLGISGAYVTDLESGKNQKISLPLAKLICYEFGVNLDWLLTGEGPKYREGYPLRTPSTEEKDLSSVQTPEHLTFATSAVSEEEKKKAKELGYTLVPRYDVLASAGGGADVHSEQVVDHLAFKTAWLKTDMGLAPNHLTLISAVGDSMEPTIREGDLLLIDHTQDQVTEDAIYVLRHDGLLIAKRLQKALDGTIYIRSDNTIYKELTVSKDNLADLRIVGRVVWFGRKI